MRRASTATQGFLCALSLSLQPEFTKLGPTGSVTASPVTFEIVPSA